MLSPYAWLAVGALVLTLFAGTYWKGYTHGRDNVRQQWEQAKDAQVVAENKAIAARIAENAAAATKANAEKIAIKKGYENEIVTLRAARAAVAPSLYVPSSICEGFTATAEGRSTGRGSTDPAATRLLPPAPAANLYALVDQADEIVAGCRVAQEFIKSQGMAP